MRQLEIPILWVLEMTCNDLTCRVCNVDRNRLCPNELANRRNKTPDSILKTGETRIVQHQLGLLGSGDFCRLGCCDFSQKYAKHTCKKEQRS